jgi:hypothetical protein
MMNTDQNDQRVEQKTVPAQTLHQKSKLALAKFPSADSLMKNLKIST